MVWLKSIELNMAVHYRGIRENHDTATFVVVFWTLSILFFFTNTDFVTVRGYELDNLKFEFLSHQ